MEWTVIAPKLTAMIAFLFGLLSDVVTFITENDVTLLPVAMFIILFVVAVVKGFIPGFGKGRGRARRSY